MTSLSPIDKERFGIVTARDPHVTAETLGAALEYCRANRVELLIARCAADDLGVAQSLESAGGRLMDTLVYYSRSLDAPLPEGACAVPIRPARPEDAAGVRRVASESFRGYRGHYHADPRLERERCDEIYPSWAHRSCVEPGVATRVLVADHEGRIAGFLTMLERGPDEQEIVLNGVEPRLQRHGIYRSLVVSAIGAAHADGAKRLGVSTQLTNVAVQKVWVRLGFELSRSYYTFHLWLSPP